jgi:hypothetical protein
MPDAEARLAAGAAWVEGLQRLISAEWLLLP